MTVDVFVVGGTGEPVTSTLEPAGMLSTVTKRLNPTKYRCRNIPYPASIGPANAQSNIRGIAEAQSVRIGVNNLAAAVRATPNMAGVIGYSLGAIVVSEFVAGIADGRYADCELSWVANVANPLRAAGDSITTGAHGHGIAGQHRPWPRGLRSFEVANPADPITCLDPNSPLRTLADQITYASLDDLHEWGEDLIDRALTNRWQPIRVNPFDLAASVRRYRDAMGGLYAYLYDGQHFAAYVRPRPGRSLPDVELLAQRLNAA